MTEDLKGLIEKIQREGVNTAQTKAKAIEEEANQKAAGIIEKAKAEAQRLIAEAKKEVSKTEASGQATLKQAGRDLILLLRKEISSMLDKLLLSKVREALTPAELTKILASLIEDYDVKEKGEVVITLKKEDLESLKKSFLDGLKEEIKKGITLNPSEDIQGGFIISYDGNKSHFDFTDKALAEFLSNSVRPALEDILKDTDG